MQQPTVILRISSAWKGLLLPAHRYFNSVQSAAFPAVFLSNVNVVVSAPTGSGKTGVMELAILRLMQR